MIFFLVSTLNSKVGLLCSARLRKRLKLKKSFAIQFNSGVELNNDIININKL